MSEMFVVEPINRMDPEFKALWVSALRSGRYTQYRGALRNGDSYCCLGVACEISPSVKWEVEIFPNAAYYRGSTKMTSDPYSLLLPERFPQAIGLTSPNPSISLRWNNGGMLYVTLSSLNDGGFTFSQIADVIDYFF